MTLRIASSAFLAGYRTAHACPSRQMEKLAEDLRDLGPERTPFAVEGAAMALETRRLVESFVERVPRAWLPFAALGRGCALARAGAPPPDDPMTLDGYGFHLALFGGAATRSGAAAAASYQRGVGRGIWFRTDGNADASAGLASRVGGSPVWAGLATACTFAGDPRGHAARLRTLGVRQADAIALGAEEALESWRSLGGPPPARAVEAAQLLAGRISG